MSEPTPFQKHTAVMVALTSDRLDEAQRLCTLYGFDYDKYLERNKHRVPSLVAEQRIFLRLPEGISNGSTARTKIRTR